MLRWSFLVTRKLRRLHAADTTVRITNRITNFGLKVFEMKSESETSTPRQPLSPSNSMIEDKEHWARSGGVEPCKAAASNAKEEEDEEEEDALSPSKVIPQQFHFDPNHWCPSRRIRGHHAVVVMANRRKLDGGGIPILDKPRYTTFPENKHTGYEARGPCHSALAGGPREYREPLSSTSNSIKRFHTHAVFRIPNGARRNGSERPIEKKGANEVRWDEGGGNREEEEQEDVGVGCTCKTSVVGATEDTAVQRRDRMIEDVLRQQVLYSVYVLY